MGTTKLRKMFRLIEGAHDGALTPNGVSQLQQLIQEYKTSIFNTEDIVKAFEEASVCINSTTCIHE